MKEHVETLLRMSGGCLTHREQDAIRAAIKLFEGAKPKDEAAEREHCRKVALDIQTTFDPVGQVERERAAVRAEVEAKYAALLKPRDAEAERAHCISVVAQMERVHEHPVATLMRERRAARAEGYAQGTTDAVATDEERISLAVDLAAARNEIELWKEASDDRDFLKTRLNECREKLSAAQAELATAATKLASSRKRETELAEELVRSADAEGALKAKLSAAQAEIERLAREKQSLIDQEVGQAMDCAKHERESRAEERAKCQAETVELKAQLTAAHTLNNQCATDFANKLSAAQAEIERLKSFGETARLDVMWQNLVRERDAAQADLKDEEASHKQTLETRDRLKSELSAAQAEIASLKRDAECAAWHKKRFATHQDEINDLMHAVSAQAGRAREALAAASAQAGRAREALAKLANLRAAAELAYEECSEPTRDVLRPAIEASKS